MTYTNHKKMKDVVSQLRAGAAEALLELFELHIAVGELAVNLQVLSAVAVEVATECTQLADGSESVSRERLLELANAATKMKEATNGQLLAFEQMQRGLDAWNIVPPGLRLVGTGSPGDPR
jgi:methyl-accepting chemotaxis protein